MDTDALNAFIAVTEQGSFSLAGEQLHLTQPAISKRIAVLEQQLNCQLFDRISRTVSLTEAGRELLPRARAIVQATQDAVQAVNDLSGQVRGELKLCTSHHMGLHHLPKFLRRYSDKYPGVKLNLDFQDSEKALSPVLTGQAELAALTLDDQPHPKLVQAVAWDDPLEFVVARAHPLTRIAQPALADLSDYAGILPEVDTVTTRLIKQLFEQHQQSFELRMATNYLETIKMLVSIGLGWGVLPRTMIDTDDLQPLPLGTTLVRRLGIIHLKERSLSNASRAFLSLF